VSHDPRNSIPDPCQHSILLIAERLDHPPNCRTRGEPPTACPSSLLLHRTTRERDERSLTRILHGLDGIDTDRHERDAPPPLDVVALAVARQQRSEEEGS